MSLLVATSLRKGASISSKAVPTDDGDPDVGAGAEDPDDAEMGRPPLPPEDRLWRHPSELSSVGPPSAPAVDGGRRPHYVGSRRRVLVGAVVGAAAVAVAAVAGVHLSSGAPPALNPGFHTASVKASGPSISTPESDTATSVAVGASVMAMVERVAPALVVIQAHTPRGDRRGTGIVYESDGVVVTTEHLVDGASSIAATTSGGQEVAATLVGEDKVTDVAVVRIPGHGLPTATFSSAPSPPAMGEITMVVLSDETSEGGSATYLGTVRGVNEQVANPGGEPFLDMIATDAPVSGNVAGGALLDSTGSVVGVTSAVTGSGSGERCLATPSYLFIDAARQLISVGEVAHGWLGIEGRPLQPPSSSASPSPTPGAGVQVVSVAASSPAATSGIEVGDTIASVDSHPVSSMLDLQGNLHELSPGDEVTVDVVRNSQLIEMKTKLAAAPSP